MFIRFKECTLLLVAVLMIGLSGCTRNDAQREFEKEAYAVPRNFTRTTFEGAVTQTDEDDWRISPLFQGFVDIAPPYPNPVTTDQQVRIEISVTAVQSIAGVRVLVRFEDGTPTILYESSETLELGLTVIQINPIEFSQTLSPEGARGLNRIYIFNGNQQMISYGDIMVE